MTQRSLQSVSHTARQRWRLLIFLIASRSQVQLQCANSQRKQFDEDCSREFCKEFDATVTFIRSDRVRSLSLSTVRQRHVCHFQRPRDDSYLLMLFHISTSWDCRGGPKLFLCSQIVQSHLRAWRIPLSIRLASVVMHSNELWIGQGVRQWLLTSNFNYVT